MELRLFVLFFALAMTLLILAFFYDKRNPDPNGLAYVKLTAWLILFLTFIAFAFNGLQLTYGYSEFVEGNYTTVSPIYEDYFNLPFGIFLTLMAGIGFIMVFFDLRGVRE